MRKLMLSTIAIVTVLAAVTISGNRSQAAVIAPAALREAADELNLVDTVAYIFGGHRYCWYSRGWRGAGWYRCGFEWRRGFGWGGPAGWRGWRRPSHPAVRPPPSRPGVRPLPARPGAPIPGRPGPGGGLPPATTR